MQTIFGYLSEFWNAITDTVAGGVTYTADFFKNIGNAVAGSLGPLLLAPFKVLIDLFLALAWLLYAIYKIIIALLAPLIFIFYLLWSFVSGFFSNPPPQPLYSQDQQILAFLNSFPLFQTLISVVGFLILTIGIIVFLKQIKA